MNFWIETYKLVFLNTDFTLLNVVTVTLQSELLAFNTETSKNVTLNTKISLLSHTVHLKLLAKLSLLTSFLLQN